jgi:serine/threonine protein kinase/predicted ATPase
MQTEPWNRARELFEKVLDLPVSEREPFLETACGGDAALLGEVREMLAAFDGDSFLEHPPPHEGLAVSRLDTLIKARGTQPVGDEPANTDGSPGATALPSAVGPYRILGTLGRGGMGTVYRGQHSETGELAAVKTVSVPSEASLAGIRREIHALARVRHPGIVRIVAEGVDDAVPWYAMELLDGSSLRSYRRAVTHQMPASPDPPDSPPAAEATGDLHRVLTLARRLCAPLAFLHGEGIVHRDLKPDNILVRPSGQPVLVDFGIASSFAGHESRDEIDAVGSWGGTLAYMAPEQIRGEYTDARADLYALGCILYELIARRPPFIRKTGGDFIRAHLHEVPKPPSAYGPGIPDALDALVLRLLAKSPAGRIGYAADVAAALARLGADAEPDPYEPRPRTYLYRPAFAGRADALASLEGSVAALVRGAGGLVLVGGESGIGKTRLMIELGHRAEAAHVLVLMGECLPREAQSGQAPLHALRKPLRRIADRCRERGERETDALLGPRGRLLAPYEPTLADLPGQGKFPEPAELPPTAARLRLLEAVARTFAELARSRPLLLVLDDLQWGDELTLGLVEYLARGEPATGGPVLVVGTYRSEEQPEALRSVLESDRGARVDLGRLEEPAVASMVGGMLSLEPSPPVLSGYLSRQSEGNPFFVAEYLRAAVEERLLWRDEHGTWQVDVEGGGRAKEVDYERLGLPRSLRALVERRLGGLERGATAVVAVAAVLGRETDAGLLEQIAGLGGVEFLEPLDEVLRRQILEDAAGGRLRFTHDKLREAAYDAIPPDERARLHGAAARALEARPDREGRELAAALGHHWERAGEPATARPYYLEAARSAKGQHAHNEAIRLFRAYLRLVDQPTVEGVGARNELGNTLNIHGRASESIEEHQRALDEARALRDIRAEGESIEMLGIAYQVAGRVQEAIELLERALAIHRETGDSWREASVLTALANCSYQQGDLEQARSLDERALEIEHAIGDRRGEGIALGNLGTVLVAQGNLEESITLYERALAIHREVGNRFHEGMTLNNLADARHEQGLLDDACSLYEQALVVIREVGYRLNEGLTVNNLAVIHAEEGHVERARALYEQALAIAREVGVRRLEAFALSDLAVLERRAGDLDRAEHFLREAEARFRDVGDRIYLALCVCERGHAELARGRPAADVLERARESMAALHTGPESRLGKAVSQLERAVDADGRSLHRGECAEDIPAGLRRILLEAGTTDG